MINDYQDKICKNIDITKIVCSPIRNSYSPLTHTLHIYYIKPLELSGITPHSQKKVTIVVDAVE